MKQAFKCNFHRWNYYAIFWAVVTSHSTRKVGVTDYPTKSSRSHSSQNHVWKQGFQVQYQPTL